MGATVIDARVPPPRQVKATEAARLALAGRPRPLTPARARVEQAAAVLWCRHLQFPTVRAIGRATGLRSPSTIHDHGRPAGLQAAIIAREWERIGDGWLAAGATDRAGWLADHATSLAAVDPTLLRLPGLVCSAVVGSGVLPSAPPPAALVPFHALAAFADVGGSGWPPPRGIEALDLDALATAVARIVGRPHLRPAVSA
jgi:hypothetical protein